MPKKTLLCLIFVSALVFSSCIIKGKVVDENGKGLAGVAVTLSGETSMTTTTDSSGFYQFGNVEDTLSDGSYTVTPSKPGYGFTPASRNVTITTGILEGYGEVPWPVDHVDFSDARNENIVVTLYGSVAGFKDEADTCCWRGIPFAKPPIGELRWKAPLDPDPWEGVRVGTEFGHACLQIDSISGSIMGSDDCLYLNIWRPQSDENNLPVYVRIHGGGNSTGAASFPEYYGANLSSRSNMVYVSVQYRLGPLGWFTHPALRTGDAKDDSGNYGTLDLIKALEWIQENIKVFGGNPDNVFIAGESAGGVNVCSLLLSPLATGLFQKAMSESGRVPGTPIEVGEESVNEVLLKLLVNDGSAADQAEATAYLDNMSDTEIANYLRSKPAGEIHGTYKASIGGVFSFPNIFTDGTVIVSGEADAFEAGTYPNKVPIILGTNKDETKLTLYFNPAYPDKDGEVYQTVTKYSSDFWKVYGADGLARKLRSHPDQPEVYVYQFLWGSVRETGESVLPDSFGSHIGAMHGLEIPFFLGNEVGIEDKLALAGIILKTEQNRPGREALSEAMMAYVAEFIRTGDPNQSGSGLPEWTPWSNTDGESKCILFDADYNDADIEMSTTEVTEEGLLEEISMLPEALAEAVASYFDW